MTTECEECPTGQCDKLQQHMEKAVGNQNKILLKLQSIETRLDGVDDMGKRVSANEIAIAEMKLEDKQAEIESLKSEIALKDEVYAKIRTVESDLSKNIESVKDGLASQISEFTKSASNEIREVKDNANKMTTRFLIYVALAGSAGGGSIFGALKFFGG